MVRILRALAYRIHPELKNLTGAPLAGQLVNTYMSIFSAPLAVLSLVWLGWISDLQVIAQNWWLFILLEGLIILFYAYRFEMEIQLRPGVMATTGGTLGFVVAISAVFIFGPTAYWLSIVGAVLDWINQDRKAPTTNTRWAQLGNLLTAIGSSTLGFLLGIYFYQLAGGQFPLTSLEWEALWPGIILLLCYVFPPYIIMSPMIWVISRSPDLTGGGRAVPPSTFLTFLIVNSLTPQLALPFALLAALLYSQNGLGMFFFFLFGVLLASILASALTNSVKQRTQRARELAALENLGRNIIAAPPTIDALPPILEDCFSHMFARGRGRIWLTPENILFTSSAPLPEWDQVVSAVKSAEQPHYFIEDIHNTNDIPRDGLAVPILDSRGQAAGGVYFSIQKDQEKIRAFLPAVQSLAAQVSSALYRIQSHKDALLKERMSNELEIAGRIQANFLPGGLPSLPGYEIAASITPARQTSGDFYDFIPLPDGRLGILVADVADKGTGAALFMALSRTLLRTYALEHPGEPEHVMHLANQRILEDTQSALFVTTFYGVINPQTHEFTYVNGGHNPPYLFKAGETANGVEPLTRTGIPLGIFEDARWTSTTTRFHPGSLLVLYTDGVTEAENDRGEFFEDPRLLATVRQHHPDGAQAVHDALHTAVKTFAGDVPQGDDITLMVIMKS